MAQFDVHAISGGTWVVNVQSDLVSAYRTKLVIPLVVPDDDAAPVSRLNPLLTVQGEARLLATHLAGAVPTTQLGKALTSIEDQEFAIKAALDLLISGF